MVEIVREKRACGNPRLRQQSQDFTSDLSSAASHENHRCLILRVVNRTSGRPLTWRSESSRRRPTWKEPARSPRYFVASTAGRGPFLSVVATSLSGMERRHSQEWRVSHQTPSREKEGTTASLQLSSEPIRAGDPDLALQAGRSGGLTDFVARTAERPEGRTTPS
jgi:hypothetical protein